MKTTTQIKARKSFEYQCKRASKCRHENYRVSCLSCATHDSCEIQKAIEKARERM